MPDVLVTSLQDLIDHGYAQLEEQPEWSDQAHVEITPAGEALLIELRESEARNRADRPHGERQ